MIRTKNRKRSFAFTRQKMARVVEWRRKSYPNGWSWTLYDSCTGLPIENASPYPAGKFTGMDLLPVPIVRGEWLSISQAMYNGRLTNVDVTCMERAP